MKTKNHKTIETTILKKKEKTLLGTTHAITHCNIHQNGWNSSTSCPTIPSYLVEISATLAHKSRKASSRREQELCLP